MKSKDFLHKYLVLNNEARVISVFSTNTVKKFCKIVNASPLASAVMGRLITATAMMGSTLKGQEKVMVTIDGQGPIGVIRAEADAIGNVRAFAFNPDVDLPLTESKKLDVASAVGTQGTLSVRKQLNMKEPFIGTCELISGEIGEDLSYYYGTSEQTPTIVALGVKINKNGLVKQAGGFIIQLLPNASDATFEFMDNLLKNLTSVSDLIDKAQTSDQLVYQIFDEAKPIFSYPINYKCSCSLAKTKMLLMQLSKEELQEDIEKGNGLDVTCNFCQHTYHLDTKDLQKVLDKKSKSDFNVK